MVAEIKLELNTIIVLRVNSIPAFAIESDINISYLSKNSKKTPFNISWLWKELHNNLIFKVFPNIKGWDKGVVDIPYAVTVA